MATSMSRRLFSRAPRTRTQWSGACGVGAIRAHGGAAGLPEREVENLHTIPWANRASCSRGTHDSESLVSTSAPHRATVSAVALDAWKRARALCATGLAENLAGVAVYGIKRRRVVRVHVVGLTSGRPCHEKLQLATVAPREWRQRHGHAVRVDLDCEGVLRI